MTRGEAGIEGKSHAEAAAIRTAEALKACEILKARPILAGQIDGSTEITPASYEAFRKIMESEAPDVVSPLCPSIPSQPSGHLVAGF